jgi:hypothetical protein
MGIRDLEGNEQCNDDVLPMYKYKKWNRIVGQVQNLYHEGE